MAMFKGNKLYFYYKKENLEWPSRDNLEVISSSNRLDKVLDLDSLDGLEGKGLVVKDLLKGKQ
jgi:hypothetical protein